MDRVKEALEMSDRSLDRQLDPELNSLLRRVAFVSTPAGGGGASRTFAIGQTLLEGRLRIERRLGEGGMGVVYEAYDQVRRGVVALKTLTRLDAQGIYALKLEFRSLADVSHPGLCRLLELFTADDTWFFSMELIRGARFDRWVRPHGKLDEVRLRMVLPQLGDALGAIHQAGKLHRDLKASNVLVTEEGRLVVLDFGLAIDQSAGDVSQTVRDQGVCGTPAYMAPEQAAADLATPASDYYAVGAMLFEALTGKQPFEGRISEVLAAKQRQAAPAVHTLVADAPPDLSELCDRLLDRDQARRSGAQELRAVAPAAARVTPEAVPGASSASGRPPSTRSRQAILGREAELSQLASAFESTLLGRAVAVFVTGESGMGKSALANEFVEELRREERAVVLAGRCYERESVPFKAFDAVLDDLSRHLRRLPPVEASALMPRDVGALARLFPALDRIPAVASSPKRDIPDVRERQQRAFAAFGELLGRLRDRRPLVVFIDDLQWTDRDSSTFMESLFAAAELTPLLLIVSHRSEGAAENPRLQQALQAIQRNPAVDTRHVRVGPLSPEASRLLALRLAGTDFGVAVAVASEARGSPFFVGELVRHAHQPGKEELALTLENAVLRHVQSLAPAARALLEVLAVAGRPLPLQLALAAAGAAHVAVDELSSERLLRTGGGGSGALALLASERTVECYHDKIRETVFAALGSDALRGVHAKLAAGLLAAQVADPEHLAIHFHGAGELAKAAVHYQLAGDASVAALAFDAAAHHYQQALSLLGDGATGALRVRLGYALASAGSSRAAAEMYRAACSDVPSELALAYRCTAAHLLTTSGHLDEGRVLLGEVLEAIGLALPRSRRTAIAGALLSRAQLWLRGLRLEAASAAPEEAAQTNAYLRALWTVVQGALGNDPFLMVEMAGRYTRLALDAGSQRHAARALSMEAYLVSFEGPSTRKRSESLLSHAEKLAGEVADAEIESWVQEMRGCVLVHEGRFAEARPLLGAAVESFETRCQGVPFELACGRGYDLNAANHLGQFAEISRKATHIVENSLRRGDMYQASGVAGFAVQAWLAHRGLAFAETCFGEAKRDHEPQANYQWADYLLLVAEVDIALYRRDGARGYGLIAAHWPAMVRSQLLRMRIADAMIHFCRGGCLLVASQRAGSDGAAAGSELGLIRASVRTLKRSPLAYAPGWAAVLEAGLAQATGRPESAVASLRHAVANLDAAGLRMYAASARRRLGQLLLGDEGAALLAAGDMAMAEEGILDKEATTALLTPGLRC
jgi:serine/threonine protein kinase